MGNEERGENFQSRVRRGHRIGSACRTISHRHSTGSLDHGGNHAQERLAVTLTPHGRMDGSMDSDSMSAEERKESQALEAILRHSVTPMSVSTFFSSIYQDSCCVFPAPACRTCGTESNDPYTNLIRNGWDCLVQLLEASRRRAEEVSRGNAHQKDDHPRIHHGETLLFQNQASLDPDTSEQQYNHSLFAAYLDGCSIVTNHADTLSPYLAALCNDLQHSFPHAYANTYLTPPGTQTVPAHADDRDVLIIQIVGQKEWTIYQRIPIPYPYPHEQVGKHPSLPVPDAVTDGPILLQRVLQPGDVLYIPRGYVHVAVTSAQQPSLHATVALATHDWSWAGVLTRATEQGLAGVVDYRKAMDRHLGTREWDQVPGTVKAQAQSVLDQMWVMLREQVTVEALHHALEHKYREHNERARRVREEILQARAVDFNGAKQGVVGREAADRVLLGTRVRGATPEEKASVTLPSQTRGLQVTDQNYDAIIHVLTKFKQDPVLSCRVDQLGTLCHGLLQGTSDHLCPLTWLAFARQCVELGAFVVASD